MESLKIRSNSASAIGDNRARELTRTWPIGSLKNGPGISRCPQYDLPVFSVCALTDASRNRHGTRFNRVRHEYGLNSGTRAPSVAESFSFLIANDWSVHAGIAQLAPYTRGLGLCKEPEELAAVRDAGRRAPARLISDDPRGAACGRDLPAQSGADYEAARRLRAWVE